MTSTQIGNIMAGKKGVIFGASNPRSIAWGAAKALHAAGAEIAFSYENPTTEKQIRLKLAPAVEATVIEPCRVEDEISVAKACAAFGDQLGRVDFIIHSIAFANADDVANGVLNCSKKGFLEAMDISAYSLINIAREMKPYLSEDASITSLTYLGAERVCVGYNVLGVAKAALEAITRYLAFEMGKDGTRVNAISAGPVRTLSALALPNFRRMFEKRAKDSPLRRNTTIEQVGDAALYLASPLSRGVTGEVHYVDAGYNVMGTFEE